MKIRSTSLLGRPLPVLILQNFDASKYWGVDLRRRETLTRQSIWPPPPDDAHIPFPEGPVLPALRRFRGTRNRSGGYMPPPK
jgi:hypothetical protein